MVPGQLSLAQDVDADLGGVRTLEHVLDWIRHRGIDLAVTDLIAQDEYSHDYLVPLPDSRWIAFAMT